MSATTIIDAEATEVSDASPKVEEVKETPVAKASGWRAALRHNLDRGLAMVKAGGKAVLESRRYVTRHLLLKIVAIAILALALVGWVWFIVWAAMAALAISPWLLAAFVIITGGLDIGVVVGLVEGMFSIASENDPS